MSDHKRIDSGDTHNYGVMCNNKNTNIGDTSMVTGLIIQALIVVIHTIMV